MKKSHIVISDITCLKEKFCIAGFDTYEKRMKRLMIDGGQIKFRPHIVKYWLITKNSRSHVITHTEPKM